MRRLCFALLIFAALPTVAGAQPAVKPDDLRKLAESLVAAARESRPEPFQNLAIPTPDKWFADVFGDSMGPGLTGIYTSRVSLTAPLLSQKFAEISNRDDLKFHSENLRAITQWSRYPAALPVALVAAAPRELFGLWFSSKGEPLESLGYWCFVEGEFRFVGWMYVVRPGSEPTLLLLGPGTAFQDVHATRVKNAAPRYPPLARQARIQGTVRVRAGVAPDGSIRQIEVIHGHPLLIQSVLDAVRGWHFTPLQVEGRAVEAILVIDVVFELSS